MLENPWTYWNWKTFQIPIIAKELHGTRNYRELLKPRYIDIVHVITLMTNTASCTTINRVVMRNRFQDFSTVYGYRGGVLVNLVVGGGGDRSGRRSVHSSSNRAFGRRGPTSTLATECDVECCPTQIYAYGVRRVLLGRNTYSKSRRSVPRRTVITAAHSEHNT